MRQAVDFWAYLPNIPCWIPVGGFGASNNYNYVVYSVCLPEVATPRIGYSLILERKMELAEKESLWRFSLNYYFYFHTFANSFKISPAEPWMCWRICPFFDFICALTLLFNANTLMIIFLPIACVHFCMMAFSPELTIKYLNSCALVS